MELKLDNLSERLEEYITKIENQLSTAQKKEANNEIAVGQSAEVPASSIEDGGHENAPSTQFSKEKASESSELQNGEI